MSRKIKDTPENKKFSKKSINSKTCEVPDTSIFFSFQYITSDDHYNLNYLKKIKSGKEKAIYFDLFSSLSSFSQSSWKELQLKRKQSGGYETIEYGEMKESVVVTVTKEHSEYVDTGDGKPRKKTVKEEVPQIVEIPAKLSDANKAAELLGKRYSLFTDKVQAEIVVPKFEGEDELED